nr:N-6 DNA methylase [Brevibacterium daeguense]
MRKRRGAFFTPAPITEFLSAWAIRSAEDRVMEPSAGDAAFLVAAVRRLRELSGDPGFAPQVDGVEIHAHSAQLGRTRVEEAGGSARISVRDFFLVPPSGTYDAVIGNPPYIRYQDFSGEARTLARAAALRAGVTLTGLASSWAAFTVHSALFLREGGRLGLVLPAELLSVNYAAPVRRFLFDSFRTVELVLFEEQVFPEAEADVVLLLADGYRQGPAVHATFRQSRNAGQLAELADEGLSWTPDSPEGKWTGSLIGGDVADAVRTLASSGTFAPLQTWGETTLGIVTGNNKYFTLSPARVRQLGLRRSELLRLSPPGSAHLRGLSLTKSDLSRLGSQGRSTYLFYPPDRPSAEALAYIRDGERTGVDSAYKCRVRKTWYRVPIVPPADLLLTYMNADTPRLTSNLAGVHHLNSVHGVYLRADHRELGRDVLPVASLNSVTLLNAEMVGRAYGGGILKIEPKEADQWLLPSPGLVASLAQELHAVKDQVARLLRQGRVLDAVHVVDSIMFTADEFQADSGFASDSGSADAGLTPDQLHGVRQAHAALSERRRVRGASGR